MSLNTETIMPENSVSLVQKGQHINIVTIFGHFSLYLL